MPAPKKPELLTEDLILIIGLIKERDKLYAMADIEADMMQAHKKAMVSLRNQARALSCKNIAEKFGIGEHTVTRIANAQIMQDEIEAVDPVFYFANVRDDERLS